MTNRRIDRRTAIKHLGVGAAAAALAPRLLGCSSDGGPMAGPADAGGPRPGTIT